MYVNEVIARIFFEVLEQTGSKLAVSELSYNVVLLDSGLDSLGFAILVARLDEELGYDPFTIMDEPIYPKTFGEFVQIYKSFGPGNN